MTRAERFLSHKNHPMLCKDFKRLGDSDIEFCLRFLADNEGLDDNAFVARANRLGVSADPFDVKEKNIVWGLLIQSIEPKIRRRK